MRKKNNNIGQSLIEVVAAIAVISVGILAIVKVTTKSVSNTTFARNRAIATKYAQESLEKVREYRDKNSWVIFTANCGSAAALGLPEVLSPFTRTTYSCTGSGDSRDILVIVSWTDASGSHQSRMNTSLTAWK